MEVCPRPHCSQRSGREASAGRNYPGRAAQALAHRSFGRRKSGAPLRREADGRRLAAGQRVACLLGLFPDDVI